MLAHAVSVALVVFVGCLLAACCLLASLEGRREAQRKREIER